MAHENYRIFTTEFDEVVSIDSLAEQHFGRPVEGPDDWEQVAAYFSSHAPRYTKENETAIEAALADLSSAAAVLGAAGPALTLLVDNSGSMRGHAIYSTSTALHRAAPVLAEAGIRLEIAGFSTAEWKGGRARKKWLDEGRPHEPGRLNATRHILYCDGDAPWTSGRESMLLAMTMNGLLKENFENEAIRWAASRLLGRDGPRAMILLVDSDRPIDDATLSANEPDFLRRDLKAAITETHDSGIDFETIFINTWVEKESALLYRKERRHEVACRDPSPSMLIEAITRSVAAIGSRIAPQSSPRP